MKKNNKKVYFFVRDFKKYLVIKITYFLIRVNFESCVHL